MACIYKLYKNPIARWHVCEGSINDIAFSSDGAYLATVGRDGYLRVFNFRTEQLVCGGKSYYGGHITQGLVNHSKETDTLSSSKGDSLMTRAIHFFRDSTGTKTWWSGVVQNMRFLQGIGERSLISSQSQDEALSTSYLSQLNTSY